MAADVVGYSRLMEQDEAGTLAMLKTRWNEVLQPLVARHQGRVFKVTGDGVLVEFGSALDAVECAMELQSGMAAANGHLPEVRWIVLRIGINLGDVIVEGGDRYGETVNIATRLEGVAEPGGIVISGTTYDYVRNKVKAGFEDLGTQTLKNIAEPVHVYRVAGARGASVATPRTTPAKPSIAVLPFVNMSGDAEQEYFSDGMAEEIITALSRMRSLVVIARNSSFRYKGRSVDVKQVGRELGVRYVLEGSVRKAASRLRITGQLIDAETGAHLWADRFDGGMEDIFDLQDQVTARVVGAIAPKLEEAEIERVRRKPTASLDAYDCFLRGMAGLHKWSREGSDEALAYFYRAIELDPDFATAHGLAARAYVQRNAGGWVTDRPYELAEARRLARRAVELGHDDAVALCTAGFALADLVGEIEDGDAFIEKALALNPNLAWAWLYSGWVKAELGNADLALERIARARRLSPHDPQDFSIQSATAFAHFIAARYGEALASAQAAVRDRPNYQLAICLLAASAAMAGRAAEAQKAIDLLLRLNPDLRIADVRFFQMIRRADDIKRWTNAFRKAGLPE
ncbi:MAG TPA: adenylate/guanylate cyclase domain-containing protein [Alphaproteobacteria bacterium]|nr:adenylate/guanylate cyclase domain-containing protein [Alphaproteobacteria bacterium]